MNPIAWHITFDLRGRLPLARDSHEWDAFARIILRVASQWKLIAWCLVHDHLHLIVAVGREDAGQCAQALECALGWVRRQPATPQRSTWNPPRMQPVRDRKHLEDATRYVLRNGAVSTGADLATWRWSSAWDVLGLRVARHSLARGYEVVTREFVAEVVFGDPRWQPKAAPRLDGPADPLATIARVAAAALGFADGCGRMKRPERAAWRRLTLALARHRGWAAADVARTLQVSSGSAARIARSPTPVEGLPEALALLAIVLERSVDQVLPAEPPDPRPWPLRRAPPSPARPSP